jgi:hypothetical protein
VDRATVEVVKERRSWLPPGLESAGLEPDDRASQRGKREDKRSDREAAEQGPYDQERPQGEKQQRRSEPEGGKRRTAGGRKASPQKRRSAAPKADGAKARAKRDGAKAKERTRPPQRRDGEPSPRRRDDEHTAPQAQRGDEAQRSDVDAMGQEKHRKVVGKRYGLSRARQIVYYGIFVVFVVLAYIGLKAGVGQLDKPPAHNPNKAPWSKRGAPQTPLGGFEPSRHGQKGPTHFQ